MQGALVVESETRRADDDDSALAVSAASDPGGAAFRTLYERHRADVFRFLLRLVSERSLAEDLLQDAFFRAYQNLERYDPGRPFRPWLFRIARNAGLNALRQRKKGGPKRDVHAVDPAASDRIAAAVGHAERRAQVAEALTRISDDARALLVQRHGLGMKLSALAESWGVTERTIRNRLHAAIAELTHALLAQGGSQ